MSRLEMDGCSSLPNEAVLGDHCTSNVDDQKPEMGGMADRNGFAFGGARQRGCKNENEATAPKPQLGEWMMFSTAEVRCRQTITA